MKDIDKMRHKLNQYGINTDLEKNPSLSMGDDTKQNYHQLMRVLKRLTIKNKPGEPFMKKLHENFMSWRKNIPYSKGQFQTLTLDDENYLSKIFDFDNRQTNPVGYSMNTNTVISVYEGPPYRNQRIYMGNMRNTVDLPSGLRVNTVILISKETAIFLNWLSDHFPINTPNQQHWEGIYSGKVDNSYYGVFALFIIDKLNETNANLHKEPLDEIFNQFFLDYTVSYSGVMQKREDERLKTQTIATAYLTKKNIPKDISNYMKKTKLLQLFNFVEFDEDIKRESLLQFEKDVLYFSDNPLFQHRVKSLRIRKLGKHSSHVKTTNGLYYPSLDNISLDLNALSSFVHEWGHSLDSHHGRLSTHDQTFLEEIHSVVVHSLHKQTDLTKQRAYYYSMPSEVFARSFEWYIFDKYQPNKNSALYSQEEYTTNGQFIVYKGIENAVRKYFSQLELSTKKHK